MSSNGVPTCLVLLGVSCFLIIIVPVNFIVFFSLFVYNNDFALRARNEGFILPLACMYIIKYRGNKNCR